MSTYTTLPNLSYFSSLYIWNPKQQRMRMYRIERELVVGKVGGRNTHVAVDNGQEDCVYVPSTSSCNVHHCDSNPPEYYALSRANQGLNPRLKKQLGSAGVTVADSLDLKMGDCSDNKYCMELSLTAEKDWRHRSILVRDLLLWDGNYRKESTSGLVLQHIVLVNLW